MNATLSLFGLSATAGYLYHGDTLHGLAVGVFIGCSILVVMHAIHAFNVSIKEHNKKNKF
jgi:hypothetical protein